MKKIKKSIEEIEEKYNYIDEENKNLKILLDNSQSKYKILEDVNNELNDNNIKLENNLKNINNKKMNYKI